MRGKFIVFEGGEGAGKTSQLRALKEKYGDRIVVTREPGGSPFAEKIRELVLSDAAQDADGKTNFALFWAARADHLRATIIPALEAGKVVIVDRFDSSTYAYQICAQNERSLEQLFWQMRETYLGDVTPDSYIYLHVDAEVGLARKTAQKDEVLNHFDARKVDFHTRMQAGFQEFFTKPGITHQVVDASVSFDEVQAALCKIIDNLLD